MRYCKRQTSIVFRLILSRCFKREVFDALVVALMVVVIDERLDLCLQVCREEVVLQQDAVFQGLMPPLDLALSMWMIWRTPDVSHFLIIQPFSELTRNVAGVVIR